MASQPQPALSTTRLPNPDVRVLIVDDSLVVRSILARMVDATPGFAVAASVGTADAALAFLRSNTVSIILLDVEMPGTTGLAALPHLIASGRGARILVVSSMIEAGASVTLQALALGAAGTLTKPGVGSLAGRFEDALSEQLVRLVEPVPEPRSTGFRRLVTGPERDPDTAAAEGVAIVGIGASTGGIHALSAVLRALPPAWAVPILITQHLPSSFSPYFAAQVADLGGRPCDVAQDRMRLRPGRIVIAPGDAHVVVTPMTDGVSIRLSREPVASRCMPSVDPMFQSMAKVFGARALGIVLSGMGRDGADGAAHIVASGGRIVAQDRASSVVWGMPGAVADFSSAVLPPEAIGALIAMQHHAP